MSQPTLPHTSPTSSSDPASPAASAITEARPDAAAPTPEEIKRPTLGMKHGIQRFFDDLDNIGECVALVRLASQAEKKELAGLSQLLITAVPEDLEAVEPEKAVESIRILNRSVRRMHRLTPTSPSQMLARSLLVGAFSSYDAYLGALLKLCYTLKPELLGTIEKSVPLREIVSHTSIDEIKDSVVDDDIESLRRESYIEQFKKMETKFKLKLRAFTNWPRFVECSQRRNIMVHCDGIVSEQYLAVCAQEGAKIGEAKVGTQLFISTKYLLESIALLKEVGSKLGHTLWRKLREDQTELADRALLELLYDLLVKEDWELAKNIGEFATNLPHHSNDAVHRAMRINWAQAHRHSGDHEGANKIIGAVDWSSSSLDLRVAYFILIGDFEESIRLLRRVGKNGDFLSDKREFREWPLFREIRTTPEFSAAYSEIFGERLEDGLTADAKEEAKLAGQILREISLRPDPNAPLKKPEPIASAVVDVPKLSASATSETPPASPVVPPDTSSGETVPTVSENPDRAKE